MLLGAFHFFLYNLCHFHACPTRFCGADQCSSLASPKFGRAHIFYFRLTTVFCLGYRPSKHKMTKYSKNLSGAILWTSVCFGKNIFFRQSTIFSFKVRWVWEYFLNCCEGRVCSGNVPVSLGNGENAILPKCLGLFTVLIEKSYLSKKVTKKVTWAEVRFSPLCTVQSIHIRINLSLDLPPPKNPGSACALCYTQACAITSVILCNLSLCRCQFIQWTKVGHGIFNSKRVWHEKPFSRWMAETVGSVTTSICPDVSSNV